MIRVLVDGRISGLDGIGRYTRCVASALTAQHQPGVSIAVLRPTSTPRYSRDEGEELLRAAAEARADVVHVLDYRIPVADTGYAFVSTVHDVLRLQPQACYTDPQFARNFGDAGVFRLRLVLDDLRQRTKIPSRNMSPVVSLHAEFYARMLQWNFDRSQQVIVPTATVAAQCADRLHHYRGPTVSPWGIDHARYDPYPLLGATSTTRLDAIGRYLLYVGQARAHKQLPVLAAGYRQSRAPGAKVSLVCAGRDFTPGTQIAAWLAEELGSRSVTVGGVSDGQLHALYRGAEALVHVAEHEGFGFTPLEALAHGTPVVAGDLPVLRETLGFQACFVDVHDAADIAAAINTVLATVDSDSDRQARKRWASRYRWARHAQDLLKIYSEVGR